MMPLSRSSVCLVSLALSAFASQALSAAEYRFEERELMGETTLFMELATPRKVSSDEELVLRREFMAEWRARCDHSVSPNITPELIMEDVMDPNPETAKLRGYSATCRQAT